MARFKIFWGKEADLPERHHKGNVYYTTDTHKLLVDYYNDMVDSEGVVVSPATRSDVRVGIADTAKALESGTKRIEISEIRKKTDIIPPEYGGTGVTNLGTVKSILLGGSSQVHFLNCETDGTLYYHKDNTSISWGILPVNCGGTGNTEGKARSAIKLATAINLRVNLANTEYVSFDGSSSATGIGVTGILGTTNGGTGNKFGKAPSAATADKLADARTLTVDLAKTEKTTFDGSASIDLAVKNILPLKNGGTGNSSGIAAKADKLTTARYINIDLGKTTAIGFDGHQDITTGITGTLKIANGGTGLNALHARSVLCGSASATIHETIATKDEGGALYITSTSAYPVFGILPALYGGTGSTEGIAPKTNKLATARTITVNLDNYSVSDFDGSKNIAIGVARNLGIANGGTGGNTVEEARANLNIYSKIESDKLTAMVHKFTITPADWQIGEGRAAYTYLNSSISCGHSGEVPPIVTLANSADIDSSLEFNKIDTIVASPNGSPDNFIRFECSSSNKIPTRDLEIVVIDHASQ